MYSSAPRSEYVSGPLPVSAIAWSSMRAFPAASEAGQPVTPELPLSIAGEPACSRKSPAAASTKRGSASSVRASCPLAAW